MAKVSPRLGTKTHIICRGDVPLLWRIGVEDLLDALSLVAGEDATEAEGPSGSFAGQRVESAGIVSRAPSTDGLEVHAEKFAEFCLGVSEIATEQVEKAVCLQSFVEQLT